LPKGPTKNIGARQTAAEELNSVAMPAFLVMPVLFDPVIFIATGTADFASASLKLSFSFYSIPAGLINKVLEQPSNYRHIRPR
jgi:hypothetical protein